MSTAHAIAHQNPPAGQDRLLLHAAWGLSAALFLSVGWMTIQPSDPRGSVSVLACDRAGLVMVEVLALAAMTASMATVLAGRIYPDVGAFAVGIGLTLVSFRGGDMRYVLIQFRDQDHLCLWLIVEGLFWCVTIATAMIASAVTVRWCGLHGGVLSGEDGVGKGTASTRQTGLKHLALATVLAVILIRVFAVGAIDRAISHGQACFAVAAAFYIAVGRAQAMFPVRSTFWSVCSVPLVCVIAFGLAWFSSSRPGTNVHLPVVPSSGFLRVLPITYVVTGTSAALLAYWRSVHRHEPART